MRYVDKHGNEIKAGMDVRIYDPFGNYTIENIYKTADGIDGSEDLGIMATNPDYLEYHPDIDIEYYSLIQFDACDIEIVSE